MAMPPRGPTASPAAVARPVSGRTPIAATTTSAGSRSPVESVTSSSPIAVDRRAQVERDPGAPDAAVDGLHHLGVEGRHDLVRGLDDSRRHAAVDQVLGHLQADEPAADDDGRPRVPRRPRPWRPCPRRCAARARARCPGSGGRTGRGAGREDQRVVAELLLEPGREVAHDDDAPVALDADRLVAHAHVEPEAGRQRLRGLEQQRVAPLDDAAHVVRQPAVRERDVAAALDDGDPGRLVEAAKPGRRGHPARDPSDDDDVHHLHPTGCGRRCRGPLGPCSAGNSHACASRQAWPSHAVGVPGSPTMQRHLPGASLSSTDAAGGGRAAPARRHSRAVSARQASDSRTDDGRPVADLDRDRLEGGDRGVNRAVLGDAPQRLEPIAARPVRQANDDPQVHEARWILRLVECDSRPRVRCRRSRPDRSSWRHTPRRTSPVMRRTAGAGSALDPGRPSRAAHR